MKKTLILLVLAALVGCTKDRLIPSQFVTGKLQQAQVINQQVTIDPSGFAPLTAQISFATSVNTTVKLTVVGKHGAASDVVTSFKTPSTDHQISVLGLYPDYLNTVEITLIDEKGVNLGTGSVNIQTKPISTDMPKINVDVPSPNPSTTEMNMVSYFGYDQNKLPQRPFMFDDFGDIRWYLDYKDNPTLSGLYYEDGIKRLKNGNYFFADVTSGAIYEVDNFGSILHSWPLKSLGYDFSHEIIEMPNGNFLVAASKIGESTVEDKVLEVDRNSGSLIKVWDLKGILQYGRQTLTTDKSDWFHINSVEYDPSDGGILVSGRVQGVIKLDANNNVEWIMAPHRDWALADNGVDLPKKLLTPLDGNGNVIEDESVIDGATNATDFEWNWCQHAVKFLPNGQIIMFDDGDERNFGIAPLYSRAVKYLVDPKAMTVKQIWTYGKERGEEIFSKIVSNAYPDPITGNVVMSSGSITSNGAKGKVIEIDNDSKKVLFEATVVAPHASGPVTFHRSNRMTIYPNQ